MWNIQGLAKYQKINYTGFADKNIAYFIIDYKTLANTLI